MLMPHVKTESKQQKHMNPFHVDKCPIHQMISQGKLPRTKDTEKRNKDILFTDSIALLIIRIIDDKTLMKSINVLYFLVLHQERRYGVS